MVRILRDHATAFAEICALRVFLAVRTVFQKRPHFYFLNNSVMPADFNNIWHASS